MEVLQLMVSSVSSLVAYDQIQPVLLSCIHIATDETSKIKALATANSSFSIWAYLVSASDQDLET